MVIVYWYLVRPFNYLHLCIYVYGQKNAEKEYFQKVP